MIQFMMEICLVPFLKMKIKLLNDTSNVLIDTVTGMETHIYGFYDDNNKSNKYVLVSILNF